MTFNRYSLDLERSSSQYAYVADNSALSITGDISIEAWVKFESLPASGEYQMFVSKTGGTVGTSGYLFGVNNNSGTLRFYCEFGDGTNLDTIVQNWTPVVNKWYHVALTVDISAKSYIFYVDGSSIGTQVGTNVTAIYNNAAAFTIGDYGGTNHRFDGLISNVRVWSDIRTAGEVLAGVYAIYTGTTDNLVGSWYNDANDHNDDAGTNNLTSSGSPVFSTNVPWTGANSTDWSLATRKIDHTKVSGSANLTNFPVLIKDGNLSDVVYSGFTRPDYALDLELSSSQYATNSAPSAALQLTGDLSIESWVKFESLPTDALGGQQIVSMRYATNSRATYQFYINNPSDAGIKLNFFHRNSSDATDNPNVAWTPTIGVWYHLAMTISGTTLKFYVNGVQQGANQTLSNTRTHDANSDFFVGTLVGASQYLDGMITGLRIWSDTRTDAEILGGMYDTYTGTSNNLVGSWYGNDNDSADNSNSNDLTTSGSPSIVTDTPMPVDLRITTDLAGEVEVPYEMVSLNSIAKTCEIWAKIPTVSYTADTNLYIWYGNANATAYDANASFGSQNVWETNYKRVLHLQEAVNNATSGYRDSTSYGGHGTGTSMALTAPAGQIGIAQDFDGSADYITLSDSADLEQAAGTLTFWFKPDATLDSGLSRIYYLTDKGNTYLGVRITNTASNQGKLDFILYDGSTHRILTSQASWTGGTWYKFFGTWGASGMKVVINGAADGTDAHTGGYTNTADAVIIGNNTTTSTYWDGKIDEWRFNGSQKTVDWGITEYNNQYSPSTFVIAASNIKSVAGVPYASIKKISGVAIASVKKVAGLA